ncbi:MAG: pesticidal protein Cry7Aa, partial [Saprospiraceae bacterium]|nr:pesticidal protein Cry7Aa [Saprospiraceae bacterium]
YTAYDGVNAMGALAVSKDLITWEKKGLIVPQIPYAEFSRLAGSKGSINDKYLRYNLPKVTHEKPDNTLFVWDKNVIFFPRRIDNKLYFLHRIKPDIQIVCFDQLEILNNEFWQNYFLHLNEHIVLTPKYKHEVSYIGGGCPPIETKHGWLIIYHGVCDTLKGYVYSACAALLDLKNPQLEIARLPFPLFSPEMTWELKGEVNNVCFPTGTVIREETLYIYYGAADERIACASINMTLLLNELLQNTIKNEK